MDLFPLLFMLESQLSRCERSFIDALMIQNATETLKRRHHLEGTLSDAWQAYCSFVRQLVIRSSTGCTTSKGIVHAASITPASWQRASYIAYRVSNKSRILPASVNGVLRKEPTWGDTTKIIDIVSALSPGNATTLISHLAGGLLGPKHCQTVRNACAHRNHQTRAEVEALASFYTAARIRHPTDAMSWRDPVTNQFAFLSWIDDMKTIAEGAVG